MINLYSPDNTDFTKNGNATLIPIRADLNMTLNGSWSLELEVPYDREGRWELIEEGAVIVADVNCIRELTASRQRFRIYDYKKGLSSVTAIAFPVAMESTHDAPIDNLILSGLTGIQAMAQLQTKTNKYTLNSDITKTGSTSFANTNVNNAIASGSEGCFIDVWGGEIVYDNLKFSVLERVGNNQPAKHKILYGKDLTDIQYEKDDSGLITRIYPISQDGIRLNGNGYVDSSKASQYPIIHSRYMTAPYKLIEDNISSSTATAQLTASIKSQIQTLASTLSHSVYNTAVSEKVEIEYIKKIKSDIVSAVQSMATANIIQADANRVMQSAIASGMDWLKNVEKAEWTWHGSDSTGWWYGSSTSDRATSEYEYIDRIWRYFGDNSLWQKPRDDGSGNWDWIQENSGKRYGNNMKYFAQNTYVFITMSGQMKEYWFDKEGWYDSDKSGDSDYAWHGDGSSGNPYWFGDDSTTGKYLKDGWWFIDGTYYYFDSEGYWDNTTKFDNYQWDWIEDGDNWWFGNPDKNFARTYVTNQWIKINGDWYRFNSNGYAVGDLTLENEVVARFTSGMAQLKTLCESLYTQAYNLLYSQMRSYCTKLFNTGIDVPSVTITVNMADLSNTSEYEDYQQLAKVYLGDSVTAIDYKHGISAVERIVSITYDCIRKVNSTVQIGVASSSLSDILKTNAGGSVAGGFDTSIIESTLTSHGNSIASLQANKQNKLTAGHGIEIENDVISATGEGQGLQYWEETSEDFSRTVTEAIEPYGWTFNQTYANSSIHAVLVDNGGPRDWTATFSKPIPVVICSWGDWLGFVAVSDVGSEVAYAGDSTSFTINGETFWYGGYSGALPLSNGAHFTDDSGLIDIGWFPTYAEALAYALELFDIKVGSYYRHTLIGIGDNIIEGGLRYSSTDDYPFYVTDEGEIHGKSIEVDEIEFDGKNILQDFVGATANEDGERGLVPPPSASVSKKYLCNNGEWEEIVTEVETDIFSIFDTTIISSQYTSGQLINNTFEFDLDEYVNWWSATATAYNNTAFDLSNINKLRMEIEITDQADYGAFWVTFSQTKYTWGDSRWSSVYDNIDSAIKITESGTYEFDVSNMTGNYYIYIGASTGKDSTAHGGCNNGHDGKIIGAVTKFVTVSESSGGGTEVIANPSQPATDTLKKVKIDDTIYEVASIEEVTEDEYEDLPATKNSDNTMYLVLDIEDIFDGGSTVPLLSTNGITTVSSNTDGGRGTLNAYEYSAGHEGFNIALKNLTVGNTYNLDFDFQFTEAQFIGTDYRCAYIISQNVKSDYDNYTSWTENLPRDLVKHHHTVSFTATATTMHIAFNLDGCSDSVNNYFTISNMICMDTAKTSKIMYNGNQYGGGSSGGGSTVIANPSGQATAELDKVSIDGIIYSLPSGSGGGGGFEKTTLYTAQAYSSSITLNDDYDNYDYLLIVGYDTANGGYMMSSVVSVDDLVLNNNIGLTNDSYYLWYNVDSTTSLSNLSASGSLYISKIYGLKASGGGSLTVVPCYAEFKGWPSSFIDTKIGQMDAEYYLDFYIDSYENDKAILGNNSGASYLHLTMYSNKWYTSNGSSEFSFGDSTMITGRHTFTYNRVADRKILFDGAEVGTSNGNENGDFTIRLNNRNGYMCCHDSRIYEFKITARDGTVLHDFKPVAIYQGNTLIWKGIRDEAGGMQLNGWYDIVEISS